MQYGRDIKTRPFLCKLLKRSVWRFIFDFCFSMFYTEDKSERSQRLSKTPLFFLDDRIVDFCHKIAHSAK